MVAITSFILKYWWVFAILAGIFYTIDVRSNDPKVKKPNRFLATIFSGTLIFALLFAVFYDGYHLLKLPRPEATFKVIPLSGSFSDSESFTLELGIQNTGKVPIIEPEIMLPVHAGIEYGEFDSYFHLEYLGVRIPKILPYLKSDKYTLHRILHPGESIMLSVEVSVIATKSETIEHTISVALCSHSTQAILLNRVPKCSRFDENIVWEIE